MELATLEPLRQSMSDCIRNAGWPMFCGMKIRNEELLAEISKIPLSLNLYLQSTCRASIKDITAVMGDVFHNYPDWI